MADQFKHSGVTTRSATGPHNFINVHHLARWERMIKTETNKLEGKPVTRSDVKGHDWIDQYLLGSSHAPILSSAGCDSNERRWIHLQQCSPV